MLEIISEIAQGLAAAARATVQLSRQLATITRDAVKAGVDAVKTTVQELKPAVQEPIRLLNQVQDEGVKLSIFQHRTDGGTVKNFWVLERQTEQGTQRLGQGNLKELRATEKVFKETHEFVKDREQKRAEGRERRDRSERWSVVSKVELTPGGVRARNEETYPSQIQAELAAFGTSLIVWPEPLHRRPKDGEILHARVDPQTGRFKDPTLERKRQELIWTAETHGEFHTLGRWYDRDSVPAVGQPVNIAVARMPDDHRITPDRRLKHPGEPDRPLFVLVENDTRTVKAFSTDRGEVVAAKMRLDGRSRAIQQATNNNLWKEVSFSPELRRRHSNVVTTRTLVRGDTRADFIERIHENGERTTTVLLSRDVREGDGRTRTVGRAYDVGERRQLKRVYEAYNGELKPEQGPTRTSRPGPGPQQGPTEPIPKPKQDVVPPRERDKGPSQDPKAHEDLKALGVAKDAKKPQAYFLVGVWNDAAPPNKEEVQLVSFRLDAATPEERLMTLGIDKTHPPPQGGRTRYAVVKVLATQAGPFGYGMIHGTCHNLDYAVKQCETLQRREEERRNNSGRSRSKGRGQQDLERSGKGPRQTPEQGIPLGI